MIRSQPGGIGFDLTDAIRDIVAAKLGPRPAVVAVESRPSPSRSSAALDEVEVTRADGSVIRLVCKDAGHDAYPGSASVKPRFVVDPVREIETYRVALDPYGVGPTWFGAIVEPRSARYVLVLELVQGSLLFQIGGLESWLHAAGWAARFHDQLAPAARAIAPSAHLLRYEERYYRTWSDRARAFARGSARHDQIDAVVDAHDAAIPRLLSLPATVIHGEFFAANILIRDDASQSVCPIDWEMAAIAPGLIDLAALAAGGWSESERSAIIDAYRGASNTYGRCADPAFADALDACRLHLAVRWLGWSPSWVPPAHHAHDWLAEAQRVVKN
ncbi:MAG TPA: aminoglycoside phosphotransferase family protein [Chloroflexota bacterium]|nr:aminoglycoside phosphotransferase family protein [Chloroflexota bacterium]